MNVGLTGFPRNIESI